MLETFFHGDENNRRDRLPGPHHGNWRYRIFDYAGDDYIGTGTGNDTIYAGDGYDSIESNSGDDVVFAGRGDDQLRGGMGTDILDGNLGIDTVKYGDGREYYSISQAGNYYIVKHLRLIEGFLTDGVDLVKDVEYINFWDFLNSNRKEEYRLSDIASQSEYRTVSGTSGDDVLSDSAVADFIEAREGNDIIKLSGGDDYVRGGAGRDTVVLSEARGSVGVVRQDDWMTFTRSASKDMNVTLESVERIQFSDGTLALDVSATAGAVYRLYQAAFARTPDSEGLAHNIQHVDRGLSLQQLSAAFIGSQEFIKKYGQNTSDTAFINSLYNNILGRDADAAGLAGWQQRLNSGEFDRAGVLIGFSESPENNALVLPAVKEGIWFEGLFI